VLLEQQSAGELRRLLRDPSVPGVVILLAPQAVAALACRAGLSAADAYARLCAFFKVTLGCAAVVDTAVGLDVALAEAGDEVLARLRGGGGGGSGGGDGAPSPPLPPWATPPHTLPFSATRVVAADGGGAAPVPPAPPPRPAPLPVLSSACPGWVCFAEKTLPEALPYVSAARSPQQLTGALVKAALRAWGAAAGVAVVAVMACYDKKLEATRKDFLWEDGGGGEDGAAPLLHACKEVDCVLAAGEVAELVEGEVGAEGLRAISPEKLRAGALYGGEAVAAESGHFPLLESVFRGLAPAPGGGVGLACAAPGHADSDGHCAYAYLHAARVLTGAPLPPYVSAVPFTAGRNADFREARLAVSGGALRWLCAGGAEGGATFSGGGGGDAEEGGATFTFATAYGFRNIQGVASQLKKAAGVGVGGRGGRAGAGAPAAATLAYVEVMACPKGCVGGGGLPREGAGDAGGAARVREALRAALAPPHDPHKARGLLFAAAPALAKVAARDGGRAWRALVATRYHAVPPLEGEAAGLSLANKW
jgi:iron only hydrogenase large subunit-like protein